MKMLLFSWFGFWLFVLCSLPVATGQSNLICSPEPIVAFAGDDVILPCRLDPPISVSSRAVEWTRPGLDPEYIHVHQDGRLVHQSQNPLYNYRTVLFVDQLINGNVSLKLLRVKVSDAGMYKCFLPSLWKEASVQLVVEDSVMAPSSCTACTASTAVSVLFGLMFVFTVVFFVWRWRQNKLGFKTLFERKNKERDGEESAGQQPLMEEKRNKEQLMTECKKMKEELQKKEEELKTITHVTDSTLRELNNELEKQKDKLSEQMQKTETRAKENEEKVNSVEKEVTEKEGDKTANKAQGYFKLKEILTENNWNLEERKKELQQLHMITDKLMRRTVDQYIRITGKNMEEREDTANNTEQNKKQQQDTETETKTETKTETERGD